MRYPSEHKRETHRKVVKDASRRLRAQGLGGVPVAAVMKDAGLTHGGFYKHFGSKGALLLESLAEGFREMSETLLAAAVRSPAGEEWKSIVRTYLSPEHCEHPEKGCPVATLGPEFSRLKKGRPQITQEVINYKNRMVPFMPGHRLADKEQAFFAIFSTMIGAIEIARLLPDRKMREQVLASARDFLLRSC